MACSTCNSNNCTCGVTLRGSTSCSGPRGKRGLTGAQGPPGPQGIPGEGVPPEGDTGQVLAKASNLDYDTEWITSPASSATWGFITGTLSDQLDLQAVLNTFVNNTTNATLSLSGAGPFTLGLNLSNANTWLADQSVPDEVFGIAWNGSVEVPTKNAIYDAITGLTTGVASVTATDATLTIAPTTGAVLAGLNLSNANTWLADQSVPDEAYGIGWDGSVEVPTKNAIYDAISAIPAGVSASDAIAYAVSL